MLSRGNESGSQKRIAIENHKRIFCKLTMGTGKVHGASAESNMVVLIFCMFNEIFLYLFVASLATNEFIHHMISSKHTHKKECAL